LAGCFNVPLGFCALELDTLPARQNKLGLRLAGQGQLLDCPYLPLDSQPKLKLMRSSRCAGRLCRACNLPGKVATSADALRLSARFSRAALSANRGEQDVFLLPYRTVELGCFPLLFRVCFSRRHWNHDHGQLASSANREAATFGLVQGDLSKSPSGRSQLLHVRLAPTTRD